MARIIIIISVAIGYSGFEMPRATAEVIARIRLLNEPEFLSQSAVPCCLLESVLILLTSTNGALFLVMLMLKQQNTVLSDLWTMWIYPADLF